MNKNNLIKIKKKLLALSLASIMATTGCNEDKNIIKTTNKNEITFYNEMPDTLPTPTNINLSDDYIASWDMVDNADLYKIKIYINDDTNNYESETLYACCKRKNNKIYYDLRNDILRTYNYHNLANKPVDISFCVSAKSSYKSKLNLNESDYSNISNKKGYINDEPIQIDNPSNLNLSNHYIASWDNVKNANLYKIKINYIDNDNIYEYETLYLDVFKLGNKVYYDLKNSILAGYNYHKLYNKDIKISFNVLANTNKENKNIVSSEYSDSSNYVSYYNNKPEKLDAPTNISLNDSYIASWNKVDNAEVYKIKINYQYNDIIKTYETLFISGKEFNKTIYYDLFNDILNGYNYNELYGKEVIVSFNVYADTHYNSSKNYEKSDYSLSSNQLTYNENNVKYASCEINKIKKRENK